MMFDQHQQQQQQARMRNLSILRLAKTKEIDFFPRTPSHHYFKNNEAATNMPLIADELLLNARPVTVTPTVPPSSVNNCSSILLDHVLQLRQNAESMLNVLNPEISVPALPVPVGLPTLGNNVDRLIMLRQFSGVASSNSYSSKSGREFSSLVNHGEHFYHAPLLPSRSRSMNHKEIISSAMNDLVARQSIFERNK